MNHSIYRISDCGKKQNKISLYFSEIPTCILLAISLRLLLKKNLKRLANIPQESHPRVPTGISPGILPSNPKNSFINSWRLSEEILPVGFPKILTKIPTAIPVRIPLEFFYWDFFWNLCWYIYRVFCWDR